MAQVASMHSMKRLKTFYSKVLNVSPVFVQLTFLIKQRRLKLKLEIN